jgi:hypothetical protein
MADLFVRSRSFLTTTAAACERSGEETCQAIAAEALQHLENGQADFRKRALVGESRTEWLRQHGEYYARLLKELRAVATRQGVPLQLQDRAEQIKEPTKVFDPISLNHGLIRPPCVQNAANVTCADMLAVATAICGLYLVAPGVGPIVAAICEAASIGGYINCIQREAMVPGAA